MGWGGIKLFVASGPLRRVGYTFFERDRAFTRETRAKRSTRELHYFHARPNTCEKQSSLYSGLRLQLFDVFGFKPFLTFLTSKVDFLGNAPVPGRAQHKAHRQGRHDIGVLVQGLHQLPGAGVPTLHRLVRAPGEHPGPVRGHLVFGSDRDA